MDDEFENRSLPTPARALARGRPRSLPEMAARVLAERKQKYWGPERNARRREAYANDPTYADQQRAARRASHAKISGKGPNASCAGNLQVVDMSGTLRAVKAEGTQFIIGRVFTQSDTAQMLDRQPQVIYRWLQRGIFPHACLIDDLGKRFFADDEVRAFVEILGRHQLATPHYRVDHAHVRQQIFDAAFDGRPEAAQAWITARAARTAPL